MTFDQEILVAAAAAAGHELYDGRPTFAHDGTGHLCLKIPGSVHHRWWNPLKDSGDAFELMVKLRLAGVFLKAMNMEYDEARTRREIVEAAARQPAAKTGA